MAAVWAEPLSLKDAVALAQKNNPELAAAKARWEAAKAKIPQTLSLPDPKLGLEYEQIPSGSRNLEDGMKMYTAEQMIMFPGKIAAEYLITEREAAIFKAQYRAKVLEIFSQLKSAYYDLFIADRSIEIVAEVRDLLARIRKTAGAKYIVGETIQADVLQANIEYLMMENELLTLRQERSVKEARLKALLNQSDAATIEVAPALSFTETLEAATSLEQKALTVRPELLSMKAALEGKDYSQLKAKMEFFPDLDLGVKKRVGDGWDAMLSFSVPLYFWKQGYGLAAAGLEREAAAAEYEAMVNTTRWEIREAWVMADAAGRAIKLYETSIIPQSSAALKGALAAYLGKKVEFQTLLQIERTYREAKLKYYESQANYGKALAELERITGGNLWVCREKLVKSSPPKAEQGKG
ncbi:TolC family protein [Candidatus Saganbacteria bacterium]|nr:TolC family protein [Candidatus Saganbacteria bacterium]